MTLQRETRILIVDDQPKNIQLLAEVLEDEDYEIEYATSGDEALDWVKSESFDAILLDVMMPGMSGFEVCRELKKNRETESIPVIFITARTDEKSIVKGFNVGGVDYITKPFRPEELTVRLATHIELKKGKERLLQESTGRKELLHILCHDLANSFGTVRNGLKLMRKKPDKISDILKFCLESSQNGVDMISMVRDFCALDENIVPLVTESLNLKSLLEESRNLFDHWLMLKKIELVDSIDPTIHVSVERISFINSVLVNLVTNAVKFSYSGQKIEMNAWPEKGKIRFDVRDYGIGMSESLLENVFTVSVRTHRACTSGEDGTGFGMPLVKKFVESYGGKIEIRSSEINLDDFPRGTLISILLDT